MAFRVGIDIGGTFTDLAIVDEASGDTSVIKVPSTPGDYAAGVIGALGSAPGGHEVSFLSHATTVVTNAILESKGARTALVTTRGFRDVLEIRRQARGELYNMFQPVPQVLVPRHLRLEVTERTDAAGQVVTPLAMEEVDQLAAFLRDHQVEAVAVSLLFSFLNPDHEQRLGDSLRRQLPGVKVFLSSEVLPEVREYERTSTTAVCAYVAPILESYLNTLSSFLEEGDYPPLHLMGSRGGVLTVDEGLRMPAALVESGPAAGVVASASLGQQLAVPDLVSFDMGGTTAKASLIEAGEVAVTTDYEVGGSGSQRRRWLQGAGHPIKAPVVDLLEVSAGGGSIAWVDDGGGLRVGPHSAGADPGPACYGAGGQDATVTDADMVLGYLNPHRFLGGEMQLWPDLAAQAVRRNVGDKLGLDLLEAAQGVVDIVNAGMADALRKISIERGHDPRSFSLVAFGGAGPVHAGRLAQELGMGTVVIPPNPGAFSAVGLVSTDLQRDYVRTVHSPLAVEMLPRVQAMYQQMEAEARDMLARSDVDSDLWQLRRSMDLRYPYQAYELTVPVAADEVSHEGLEQIAQRFHQAHQTVYGHHSPQQSVHLVNLRVVAVGKLPRSYASRPVQGRSGPLAQARVGSRQVFFRETGLTACPIYERERLPIDTPIPGPAILEEASSTIVVYPNQQATATQWNTITITSRK